MNILLLSNEGDITHNYIPTISKSYFRLLYTPLRTLVEQKINLPWPLKDRQAYAESASFLVENGTALFTVAETIRDGPYFNETVKRERLVPELVYSDTITYFKPISFNQT